MTARGYPDSWLLVEVTGEEDGEPLTGRLLAVASTDMVLVHLPRSAWAFLGAPGSSPASEATLERGAPSKGSSTTGLEEVH